MKTLRGRVALVTGAGSGIGREVALELARRGCRLALVDLDPKTLDETSRLVKELGVPCSEHVADVGVAADVAALPAAVATALGSVSILVNNAGIMLQSTRFDAVPDDDIERIIAINLLGVVRCSKAFLPQLLTADEAVIVNVSSLGGLVGFMAQVPYAATKFGVRGFSEALRMDLLDTRVRVIPVFPGAIQTNLVANSPSYSAEQKASALKQMESLRQMPADVAARQIVRGIEKNKPRVLIGRETFAMDILVRAVPGAYSRILVKPVRKMLDATRT